MGMVVGVCEFGIGLEGTRSLKEKRGVIKRIVHRTRNRFPIAIAEVDDQDNLEHGRIGFAVVSSDRRVVNAVIDRVLDYVEDLGLAEVTDQDFEILNY